MNGKKFTQEEEAIIREIYERGGTLRELEERIPYRTDVTLRAKSKKMGCPLTQGVKNMVTKQEVDLLQSIAQNGGSWEDAFAAIPNRNARDIRMLCYRRRIFFKPARKRYFETRKVLQDLVANKNYTTAMIAEMYGVSQSHVIYVLHRLKISYKRKRFVGEVSSLLERQRQKDELTLLYEREAALEKMLETAVNDGTLSKVTSELNIVRTKIVNRDKGAGNRYYSAF